MLLAKVKDIFKGGSSAKKKKVYHNVKLDNPEDFWDNIGELGDGAYGKVYKAVNRKDGRLAALKQVVLEAEDDLENFMIEIDILAECQHPNVVALLEAYHFDGKLWMYLEYCDGGAVDTIMVDLDKPLTEPQISYICQGLCRALKYIHNNKIIHRDLKAGNVLLTMEGGVKLADFGVSAKNKNTFDKRGTFIGTPYWLAPEVILCETFIDAKYDYKADIWSLGVSLIEFAQLDPPHHEVSPVRVMLKIQKSDPPKLDYPSRWSKEFNDFISKCLVKDPLLRPDLDTLLQHPFINHTLDPKPITDLLVEYNAEIEEEDYEEEGEDHDHRISMVSDGSQFDSESIASFVLDKDRTFQSTGDDRYSTVAEEKEPSPNDRRMSKKPAPPPPNSQTSPKKGPAPAVPSPTIVVSPVAPSSVPTTSASKSPTTSVTTTSKAVSTASSTIVQKSTTTKESTKLTKESTKESKVSVSNVKVEKAKDFVKPSSDTSKTDGQTTSTPTKQSLPKLISLDESPVLVPVTAEENKVKESDKKGISMLKVDATPVDKDICDTVNPSISRVQVDDMSKVETVVEVSKSKQSIDVNVTSSSQYETISGTNIIVSSVPSQETPVTSQNIVVGDSGMVIVGQLSEQNNSSIEAPSDVLLASISSEGTVIVRTPTPTQSDVSVQQPIKKDSIVTCIVTEETSKESSGSGPASLTSIGISTPDVASPITSKPSSPLPQSPSPPVSYSISEAEAQAVRFLESAINSAMVSSIKSDDLDSLTPSPIPSDSGSLISDMKGDVNVLPLDEVIRDDETVKSGQKLDTSEVMICNSSILQEEKEEVQSSRFEMTVEEVEEPDPHVSVVAVDDEDKKDTKVNEQASTTPITENVRVLSLPDTGNDNSVPDVQQPQVVTTFVSEETTNVSIVKRSSQTDEIYHSQLYEESKHVSKPMQKLEDLSAPTSLTIEGTTVEATDVDDDIDNTVNINQVNVMSTSSDSGISKESPYHSKLEHSAQGSPEVNDSIKEETTISSLKSDGQEFRVPEIVPLKPLQNGLQRQNSRTSERSDTDTISTVSSDKENRNRHDDSDFSEEVTVRTRKSRTSPMLNDRLTEARNIKNRELQESIALKRKTRKRTRKFVIDGVVVTTTTSKVIYGDDEESGTLSSAHLARKQELRELKIIQKQEQKQFQLLAIKANLAKQEQEKRFENEKINLLRNYDSQIENITRQQKQQVERAENKQELELKNASKRIRTDQERELKNFREQLKQESKLLKQEVEMLPKDKRKESFKIRKDQLEHNQHDREKSYLEKLNDNHEISLKRLNDDHREHIALKERQFLEEKHQLLRARESAVWDMEERQLQDKHQLSKEQLKDIYFLQRHQMIIRHNKELEQVRRQNLQKEDTLLKRQQTERRQLPKRIRQEMKTREKIFREKIRISMSKLPTQEDEKEQIKKFQEQEKIRYDAERRRAERKHRKQLEELLASNDYSIKELEHLQNEKGKMLMEHETYKLKSLDEEYQKELKEWKANLIPRKQKLEEWFEKQLGDQEKFYGDYLHKGMESASNQSTASLARSVLSGM